jgi:CRP/FNR family transcriptional regulator, nitrogen fixation regulation protein
MKELTALARSGNSNVSGSRPITRSASPAGAALELGEALQFVGTVMSFGADAEIYGEGEPSDYLYKVLIGAVRTYKVLIDGRRQVGGFYLAGDVFGLETGEEHTFSAEAITKCKVLVINHSALVARARNDQEVAFQLWSLTGRELRRLQDHLLLLIKNAPERVAAFLLKMAERLSADNSVDLPMSRRDIADHLGLTIETVSRSLTQIENTGAVEFSSRRRFVLHDRSALNRLNA